jgi:hypothetical protein
MQLIADEQCGHREPEENDDDRRETMKHCQGAETGAGKRRGQAIAER